MFRMNSLGDVNVDIRGLRIFMDLFVVTYFVSYSDLRNNGGHGV